MLTILSNVEDIERECKGMKFEISHSEIPNYLKNRIEEIEKSINNILKSCTNINVYIEENYTQKTL